MSAEHRRLEESRRGRAPWKRWGPYLSERQWGTMREDYSENGDAWNYFPHDHARSRAYKWGGSLPGRADRGPRPPCGALVVTGWRAFERRALRLSAARARAQAP
jgi:hypothetical protein